MHLPRRIAGIVAVSAGGNAAAEWIQQNLNSGAVVKEKFVGGSSWSSAYQYSTDQGARYFVKLSMGGRDDHMFRGEAMGLRAMHATQSVQVPVVHHFANIPSGRGSYIIMQFLELGSSPSQAELGRQVARMHLAEPLDENAKAGQFGFPVDNTIGGTPQPNGWMDSWVDFYRERRLRHQLQLAGDARLNRLAQPLLDNLDAFFDDLRQPDGSYAITPSILHGDLWSGNIASVNGAPAIFDPACYYGHHEAEWGMSWCAGFNDSFWRAYHEVIPAAPGFAKRRDLYQLYHYLNHYNLFGGGYYNTSARILERLASNL